MPTNVINSIFLICLIFIATISSLHLKISQKDGVCFRQRTAEGCTDYIGYMTRQQCCAINGYFVRNGDNGQIFLNALINRHKLPNCENSCDEDFCLNKHCPQNEFCIQRSNDSICSSECQCNSRQRLSKPVCLANGRKYRNMCELFKESCWGNIKPTIVECSQHGCQSLTCANNERCYLNKDGNSLCGTLSRCHNELDEVICGVNNVTYENKCSLRNHGIRKGREIEAAYKGHCRADATCSSIQCPRSNQVCINHYNYQTSPVCITCPRSMSECFKRKYRSSSQYCISTMHQSSNSCMKNFIACQNRRYIEILHSGPCLLSARRPHYY